MTLPREFISQTGYLTFAKNSNNVDYLRLAYVQAISIKTHMPCSNISLVVDQTTEKEITDTIRKEFTSIIVLNNDLTQDYGVFAKIGRAHV